MTLDKFILSLPSDPNRALREVQGALAADGVGCRMPAEDRARLVTLRAELIRQGAEDVAIGWARL